VPEGPSVAVGVTQRGLAGVGLDGSGRWSYVTALDARPEIAGDVVVGTGENKLFALDAKSGRELWRVPSQGRSLRGAGDDGTTTIVSLGHPEGGGTRLLAVSRSGKVVFKETLESAAGNPAIVRGVAFVPWQNQYVSAIDIACTRLPLLMRDQVSHAVPTAERDFRPATLVRFDSRIGSSD
jgi:outer membrane protein assembly factor BamB